MSEQATFGSVTIPYRKVQSGLFKRVPSAIRTGSEVDRSSLEGSEVPAEVSTLSGGLLTSPRIQNWQTSLDKLYYNQGIQHHIPGVACHCYALTTQATLIAANFSAYRTTGKAFHGFDTNVGQSKRRFGAAVGPYILVTTSDSDSALKVVYTGTDNIMGAAEGVWNSTRYMGFQSAGQTQDTFGVTDISADPVVRVELITHGAGDAGFGMVNLAPMGLDYMAYYGRYNTGSDGLFYSKHSDAIPITTLDRMVKTSTKNEPNSSATVLNTGAKAPGAAVVLRTATSVAPADPSNVLLDDANYCAFANATSVGASGGDYLFVHDFDFSSVPDVATLVGIEPVIRRKETAASVNAFDELVSLAYGLINDDGSTVTPSLTLIGKNQADKTTEWSTPADGNATYGGAASLCSAPLTVALIKRPDFGLAIRWTQANVASQHSEIGYVTMKVYYKMPGTPLDIPVGGRSHGLLPTDPTKWLLTVPEADELATVVMPRKPILVDISYDSGGGRVTGEKEYPNTMGLTHTEGANPGLGGFICWGDNSAGIATSLRLVRSDGEPVDLRFPSTYNGKACGIVNAECQGRFIKLEVAFEDATDTQLWYYFDSKYYASNLIQSKSYAIASLPLAWVGPQTGSELRRWYRAFPVSTTHLAVARCFMPRDLLADPLVTNTGEAKYEGVLYADSPKINLFGPTEANKTLNVIQYQGDQISTLAAATYGTVRVYGVTDGDRTFASPEVDTGAMTAAFKTYNVPSAGISIGPDKTVIFRYAIDNTGIPTKTPNLLPTLFSGTASWTKRRYWRFFIDPEWKVPAGTNWETWFESIRTLEATKATQALKSGALNVPAKIEETNVTLETAKIGTPMEVIDDPRNAPWVLIVEKDGTAAA